MKPIRSNNELWEMGSEFHDMSRIIEVGIEPDFLPFQGELFVSGRVALRSILLTLRSPATRIWIPAYVCPDVANTLVGFTNLLSYRDFPDEPSPRFDTLDARAGDVVIVQDTFGLGNPAAWAAWLGHHPNVTLIEDITHHCTQDRFLGSPAHYVFASLRKSLPLADGGIVFSKRGGLRRTIGPISPGAQLKLEAMVIKSLYLQGLHVSRDAYRELQVDGETKLGLEEEGATLSHTTALLTVLPMLRLRTAWNRNNARLRQTIGASPLGQRLSLLPARGDSTGLFHTVVHCGDRATRDRLRTHLIAHNVYPGIHWLQDHHGGDVDRKSTQLAEVLLTLPTDFRYSEDDIDRLLAIVQEGVIA